MRKEGKKRGEEGRRRRKEKGEGGGRKKGEKGGRNEKPLIKHLNNFFKNSFKSESVNHTQPNNSH